LIANTLEAPAGATAGAFFKSETIAANALWKSMATDLADAIAAAERHVAEAREIVAEQTARVQQLRRLGADFRDAERRLQLFQSNLAVFEAHLEWLIHRS
jgi:hypothetical protein